MNTPEFLIDYAASKNFEANFFALLAVLYLFAILVVLLRKSLKEAWHFLQKPQGHESQIFEWKDLCRVFYRRFLFWCLAVFCLGCIITATYFRDTIFLDEPTRASSVEYFALYFVALVIDTIVLVLLGIGALFPMNLIFDDWD